MRRIFFALIFLYTAALHAEDSPSSKATVAPKRLNAVSAMGLALAAHFDGDLPEEEIPVYPPTAPRLTVREAVVTSLEQNPEFSIARLEPEIAAQGVLEAEGQYDTVFAADSLYRRDIEPSSSALLGNSIRTEDIVFDFGLEQTLPTGALVDLTWQNLRREDDSRFTSLSPSYTSGLSLGVSQPLLQGTWWGSPRTIIRARRSLSDAAKADFAARAQNLVRNVLETYWGTVLAGDVVEVRLKELRLSRRLFKDSEEGVRVGQLAPLALSEAKAQVALAREAVVSARHDFENAGRTLRLLVGSDYALEAADYTPFVAIEKPLYRDVQFSLEESLDLARRNRPELKAQALRVKSAALSYRLAENRVLPRLNLEGRIGATGLAGRERPVEGFGPIESPSIFAGDYYDSLDTLGTGDYYDYTVGVRFSLPLENRQARARFNEARLNLSRERLRQRQLEQDVVTQVLQAFDNLESAQKRVVAAREAVQFASESLDVAREQFQTGLTTIRNVLETQRDFASAELRLAQALTDFELAVVDVHRSRGDLLEHFDITLAEE